MHVGRTQYLSIEIPVHQTLTTSGAFEVHCGHGDELEAFQKWLSNSSQALIRRTFGVGKAIAWRLAHGLLTRERVRSYAQLWREVVHGNEAAKPSSQH
jgi:hypothetical protein